MADLDALLVIFSYFFAVLGVRHELLICSVSDENSACSVVMSQWFRGIGCNLKIFPVYILPCI